MSGCPGDVNGVKTAREVEEPVVLGPWKDVEVPVVYVLAG